MLVTVEDMDNSDVIGWILLVCMVLVFVSIVLGIVRVCMAPAEGPVDESVCVGQTYTVAPVTLGHIVMEARAVGAMV